MPWRQNLRVLWPAQLLSIASFTFTLPFAPFYIQEMGVTDPARLNSLVALYAAAAPLSLFVASPFWGHMADRYGGKLMMLRSHLAAGLMLVGMGLAATPVHLIVLRVLQGLFTGTMTASQIMVASSTPNHRSGTALGILSTAQYCGAMVGIATGGIVAHHFGYRIPCFVAGGFQVISFVLVLAGTKELRRPAEHDRQTAVEENGFPLAGLLRTTLPILVVMAAIVTLRRFDDAFIPLFIQELRAGRDDAALWTGWTGAMGALAGLTAGVVLGRMSDRISPRRMVVTVCLGSAVLLYSHSLLHGIGWLIAVRAVYTFGAGGLDTLIHIWLAKTTPEERRGIAFGWAGSARAVGMMLGPLAGGAVATGLGLRPLFIVGAMLYACMAATFLLWPTNLVPKKSGGTQPI